MRTSATWVGLAGWLLLLFGLAISCGGDDGGNGNNGSGDDCTRGGQKCAFGCDSNLGCVECLNDGDCGSGKPRCTLGKCEECSNDGDCAVGQSCYPRDFKCETSCGDNGDCGGDEPLCEPVGGACVGCFDDQDCAGVKDRPICEPNRAQCSECSSDAHCSAAKPACDLQDGKCHECLVDNHCPADELCGTDQKCKAACTSDLDCLDDDKPRCNPSDNKCVGCLDALDCPLPTPLCKDDHKCVECIDDNNCDGATPVCDGDVCVQCKDDNDCLDTLLPKCANKQCVAE